MNVRYLLMVFLLLTSNGFASNCPGGGTTIFLSTGMLTTQAHADAGAKELSWRLEAALQTSYPNRDQSCIQYKVAWDSEFIDSDGKIARGANLVQQLAVAIVQWLGVDWQSAWADLFQNSVTVPGLASSFNGSPVLSSYLAIMQVAYVAVPSDTQKHINLYSQELQAGNNVIVVSHSQGNFYINAAYPKVTVPAALYFGTIGLASPANSVPFGGSYLTLFNDIILYVPLSLGWNVANNTPTDRCNSDYNSMFLCHDFVNSYLAGDVSGPQLLKSLVSLIVQPASIQLSGTGSGSILSNPGGISCSGTSVLCTSAFYVGQMVSLTASPALGSTFNGWSGACSGAATTATLIIQSVANKNACNALFNQGWTLTVSKTGSGTGTVISTPVGVNCDPGCVSQAAPFAAGTTIELNAVPAAGSEFLGWDPGGACAGAGENLIATVVLTSNLSCTATFGQPGSSTTYWKGQYTWDPPNGQTIQFDMCLVQSGQTIGYVNLYVNSWFDFSYAENGLISIVGTTDSLNLPENLSLNLITGPDQVAYTISATETSTEITGRLEQLSTPLGANLTANLQSGTCRYIEPF